MKPVRPLVRILHGSHLYGTSTPDSDHDYKSVHVPSGAAIILQRAENVIERKVKLSAGIKNEAGDTDDQSYSLQKFLGMVVAGDTNGTEILFAPYVEADPAWERITAHADKFVNRQCRGFVGYCQRQAAKYGIKGSRMAVCKAIVDLLASAIAEFGTTEKLERISERLSEFAAAHQFSGLENIPSQAGTDVWHLEVVDRKVPFTASIKTAHDIYEKVWLNYGERARAAMLNEGIDWKAVSHAVRVARQAIELLTTGRIAFPRPDAEELLAIKLGRLPYSQVSPMLEGLVELVERESAASALPEKSDQRFIDALVSEFYLEQVA
jgi:hypothetical protein